MFYLMLISSFTLIISSIVMILASMLSKKSIMDREKKMLPMNVGLILKDQLGSHFPFDFIFIAVIFLIFDVEITFLLPTASIMTLSALTSWLFTSVAFLFILLLGLYYEWYQGSLQWSD